MTGPSLLSNNC